jgi:glycosyltransferase involved in cell wall biosynthesis
MTGQNIVCFAKDWGHDPTSVNHVMRGLARNGNRVLWLNSIATRSPNLGSGKDLKKIFRKLAGFAQGARQVEENLWVYTPLVLPAHGNPLVGALNRALLRTSLAAIRRRLGMKQFQLWSFVPTATDYAGTLGEELLVFYCTDDWSHFSYVDGALMGRMMERLAGQADLVFGTSQSLADKLTAFNPETHLASHGVAHAQFARALEPDVAVPEELADVKGPILGFFGLLQDWIDLDLLGYLAERHPEWTLALVGDPCVDVSSLKRFPNVRFLGRRPHEELPAFCKAFSVGLIPHRINELTLHMNPIKLREYLSAGLPVVATDLPEVKVYGGLCTIAKDYPAFERGVAEAIRTDSPEARRTRSEAMQPETWAGKVAAVSNHVTRVRAAKYPDSPARSRLAAEAARG